MPIQIAVLDDYQGVARDLGPWETLAPEAEVTCFHDHVALPGVVRDLLAGFEVVVAMRERTPFDAELLASMPDLELLVTTGMANASIDLDAAREHRITVCGTRALAHPTAELTWGLILALHAITSISNASAISVTRRPRRPRPSVPSVRPASPGPIVRCQPPSRRRRSSSAMLRW